MRPLLSSPFASACLATLFSGFACTHAAAPVAPTPVAAPATSVVGPNWQKVDDGDGKSHLAASFRQVTGSALLFVEIHDAANRDSVDLGGEFYTRISAKDGVTVPWLAKDPEGAWVAFRHAGNGPSGPQRGVCAIFPNGKATMSVCGLWKAEDDAAMLAWYLRALRGFNGPDLAVPE